MFCRTSNATKPEIPNRGGPDAYSRDMGQNSPIEDFSLKKEVCQNLEKRGLLRMLSLGEPEQLGFTIKWYGHSKS